MQHPLKDVPTAVPAGLVLSLSVVGITDLEFHRQNDYGGLIALLIPFVRRNYGAIKDFNIACVSLRSFSSTAIVQCFLTKQKTFGQNYHLSTRQSLRLRFGVRVDKMLSTTAPTLD